MLSQLPLSVTWMVVAVLLQMGTPPTPGSQPSPPTITLDFIATGANQQPVTDISPGELTLKVGGKVRPLLALEVVSPPATGRNILLLVDEATLVGLEPVVKTAVSKLVATLQPSDRIAYVSGRRGQLTSLTTEHGAVATALEKMVTGPGMVTTCLADMVTTIEEFAKRLPAGRSTTLAVLSRGAGESSGCLPRRERLYLLADMISASQINLVLLTVDHDTRSWGMDTLASSSNGTSGLLTFANADALTDAVASTALYYRARFAADDTAPSRTQRVDLKVKRSKVKLRTSPAIFIDGKPVAGRD
jgi:hypothetical protein